MTYLIIACVVSGVAGLVIGAVWYHPKVFGTAWMKEAGLTEEDVQSGNMALIFGVSFLLTAYMAYEMKWINHDDPLPDVVHGIFHGVKNIGIFAIGALIINGLFERKSAKYIMINVGYWAVVFGVIGAILAASPSFKPAEVKEEETEAEDEATGMNMEWIDLETTDQIIDRREDTYYFS